MPTDATRLFFGALDGSGWFNNTGSFDVTINDPDLASGTASEPASFFLPAGGVLTLFGVRRRKR